MLRYASHHNYEKKAVRKSHEKTKSNKRKSKKDIATPSVTEIETNNSKPFKTPKHNRKYEYNNEDNFSYFERNVNPSIPKTWKDSWKKPLNQSIAMDEYDSPSNKVHTSKISKRQNSPKNTFIVDMLNNE